MNERLTHKCFNHVHREAAARCPSCKRFYCHECVTEHEGKVLCSACIGGAARAEKAPSSWPGAFARGLALCGGIALAWACFILLGQGLVALPAYMSSAWSGDNPSQNAGIFGPPEPFPLDDPNDETEPGDDSNGEDEE